MKANNLKTFVLFLVLTYFSLIPNLLFSQFDTAWVRRYNGQIDSTDIAYAIAIDNDGNVYITGASYYDRSASYDYVTIKYSSDGETLWVRRYNGPGNYDDYAYAIAVDAGGNVYVTGESYGSGNNYDYATIKYDSNGNELWVKRYNGPGNSWDFACAIAVDKDGNVYVTGYSEYDNATIKYSPQGNELWVSRYNNIIDLAVAIALDSLSNVYVTGHSMSSVANANYVTIKYDNQGNELWLREYEGPASGRDYASALAVDNFGNVYVTGGSEGSDTNIDYATIKYSPQG